MLLLAMAVEEDSESPGKPRTLAGGAVIGLSLGDFSFWRLLDREREEQKRAAAKSVSLDFTFFFPLRVRGTVACVVLGAADTDTGAGTGVGAALSVLSGGWSG